MKKITNILAIMLSIFLFTNCEKNDDSPVITNIEYIGFESGFIVGVDPSGTLTQEIKVATSNTIGNDRTFSLIIDEDLTTADAAAYTIPNSVTVPANSNTAAFSIDVVGANINSSGEDILTINFSSDETNIFISNPISLNLKQVCPNPELILNITFDDWPEEIYWRIANASDDTVFESAAGVFGAYDGLEGGITKPLCLASGDYNFEIYDQFADGAGPFSLEYKGEIIFSSDGSYGEGVSVTFTID